MLDSLQYDTTWQYNVIATLQGNANSENVYVVCGHYDSYAAGSPIVIAPGADDNASGTVSTFEIARVFKKKNYIPRSTIKFIAFGAEEAGLIGSKDYAKKALDSAMNILMVVNSDMISYSSTPSNWKMNLQSYNGSEWVTNLAKHICLNYTSISPVVAGNSLTGSDSYSFWQKGYPSIFLQEYDFCPYYHKTSDTLPNYNMDYCAEVIKVACGMLMQADQSIHLQAMSGRKVNVSWDKNPKPKLKGYNLYRSTTAGQNYVKINASEITDTTYIDVAPAGIYYYVATTVDSLMNESYYSNEDSATMLPVVYLTASSGKEINVKWEKSEEAKIKGYNLYRSATSGLGYVKLNSSEITDTAYIDNTAATGVYYYYVATVIDSSSNESFYSNEGRAVLLPMNSGILIVDDSDGGLLNPTDTQVDDFYKQLFSGYSYTEYDANSAGTIDLSAIGNYSTIFWHVENYQTSSVFYGHKAELKEYLNCGGNLFITSDLFSKTIEHNLGISNTFKKGSFMKDYLKINQIYRRTDSEFYGAIPYSTSYSAIYIDTLKTPATNLHHITNVEALFADTGATPIYKYYTLYDSTTAAGTLKWRSVGVEYIGTDYKVVSLSFPLYYMNFDEAKILVDYVIQNKFGEPTGIVEKSNFSQLRIYPNPANDKITIELPEAGSRKTEVVVYNLNGKEIKKLRAMSHELRVDISDLPSGIYFVKVMNENGVSVGKFVKE
ncbi:MAG: M20/M25/M40 family metallo-hydrolase [Bacteroidales bacterium]|nr:M20/M25/M40 family metallo-hydrolase [Bacteroidales bacterium]